MRAAADCFLAADDRLKTDPFVRQFFVRFFGELFAAPGQPQSPTEQRSEGGIILP